MKIWGNKKIDFLSFEISDSETLEQYLNKMAEDDWLLKKIGRMYLIFEKTDKINFKYNVDPLRRYYGLENNTDSNKYIESCKELNWEYICGNDHFKISISDKSNKEKIKSQLRIKSIIGNDIIHLIPIIMYAIVLIIGSAYYFGGYFMEFASDYSMIRSYILSIILLISLLIPYFSKIIWYINYFKKKEIKCRSLKQIKGQSSFNNSVYVVSIVLILINIGIVSSNRLDTKVSYSKESLPIVLEDYNIEIESERESRSSEQSSLLAKHSTFNDDTYYLEYRKEDGIEVRHEYHEKGLYYEVFESKYESVINQALKCEIKDKSGFGFKYKKYVSGEELDNWGANEIYIEDLTGERIVVYDNKILILNMEGKYDDKNINFIRNKLLYL